MRLLILILTISSQVCFAQTGFNPNSSAPGSFSRMGFGPRGIAIGNAVSAIPEGNVSSYYNPALSVFQNDNSFSSSYTFLSLDRSLNYLSFTRRFEFYSVKDSAVFKPKPRSTAGISVGIINSGVSKIDGRDNQGFKTGDLSTSENQFFIGFANRFSEKFALGIGIKFYYYKLYEKVTSTGLGLDIGAIYLIQPGFTVAFVISDLNSKYKWDTSPLFGTEGTATEDKFPLNKKLALSYKIDEANLVIGAEYDFNDYANKLIRFGAEYNIYDRLYLRGGIDNLNISYPDDPARPSLGFGYSYLFGNIYAGFEYAFAYEPYSSSDRHVVGLNILF